MAPDTLMGWIYSPLCLFGAFPLPLLTLSWASGFNHHQCTCHLFCNMSVGPWPTMGLSGNFSQQNETVVYNAALPKDGVYIDMENPLGNSKDQWVHTLQYMYFFFFPFCPVLFLPSVQCPGAISPETPDVLVELLVIKDYMDWKGSSDRGTQKEWWTA